ncbi:hypothetical protein ACS0TY_029017 [Phlomoides rotata]
MALLNSEASPPSLTELSARGAVEFLLPWILGVPPLDDSDPREIAVYVHQPSRSLTLIEGALDDESLLREIPAKDGRFPATKASIESLRRVQIVESGLECAICLSEFEVDGEVAVKEMPCRHKFHSDCIERWLGIHGSCPICRFRMPVELRKEITEAGGWRIHALYVGGGDLVSNPVSETSRHEGTSLNFEGESDGLPAEE